MAGSFARFTSGGGGFGEEALKRARMSGYSDSQILSGVRSEGLTLGQKAANALGVQSGGGSAASGGLGGNLSSLAGELRRGALDTLTGLANQYRDNESIGGLVIGSIADSAKTRLNLSDALVYNDSFFSTLGKYQQGLETLKAGNAMNLLAAEGGIARDINNTNNQTLRYQSDNDLKGRMHMADKDLEGTKYRSDAELKASTYGADKTLEGTKYRSDAELKASLYGADKTLEGTKYRSDAELAGVKYRSDSDLAGIKYRADTDLSGIKYQSDSEERQIGIKGSEDRKTLLEQTNQQLALRRDARGAIRTAGARFYG